MRSSASSPAATRASSTRSPPSRTRAGARSRPSGGAASPSSRPRTGCRCSRTTRTGSSATRARRPRPCTSSRAVSSSPTRPRSRRRWRPACASAGSSHPPSLAARLEARAVSNYISPPFITQATVHELIDRGAFEPNLERVRGLLRRAARRHARRARSEPRRRGELERAGGRLLPLGRPSGRRERAARPGRGGGGHVRQGRRLLPRRHGRRAVGPAGVQLRVAVGDRARASRSSPRFLR